MKVEVEQLGSDPIAAAWVHAVLSDPACMDGLPPAGRTQGFRDELCARIASGEVLALLPAVDDMAAGLYWGAPFDGGGCTVHQFVMPQFRGWPAIRCARACAEKAFALMPAVSHLVGFTPHQNRAAIACARRAGFRECGSMPAWHDGQDCAILVIHRGDLNHG